MTNCANILHFWFTELTEKQHFAKDAALDALIAQRFGAVLEAGSRCELFGWRGATLPTCPLGQASLDDLLGNCSALNY